MSTDVMTLQEYADLVQDVADTMEDDAMVLIGDVTGSLNVNAKDGFSKHGSVGYAQECFENNGVHTLGQLSDRRFYGTMLFKKDDLADELAEQAGLEDYE